VVDGRQANIKMYLGEIGWEGVDWIFVAQDKDQWRAVVKTVMHHRVSQKVRNFLTSFSRRTFFQGRSLIVKFTCVWSRTLFSRLICGSE